jgi:outer membrane protein OmpA-like peptidoglycan-associated protein
MMLLSAGCAIAQERPCTTNDDFLNNLRGFVQQARDRGDARQYDDALDAARQTEDACTRYQAYEWLGEFWAGSPQRAAWPHAVDAFLSAYRSAGSDPARAKSLYGYSHLLMIDNDPSHAIEPVRMARDLDPKNPDIAALYAEVERGYTNPTQQQIRRGLWDTMYKELPSRAPVDGLAPRPEAAQSAGSSISIPINFVTGSTQVDPQTRANVETLAAVLADPGHPQQRFTFIGHADIRGNEDHNIILSKHRAEALRDQVEARQPSLHGRIDVDGRGSSEPLDPGHNEQAYRLNRRLQVLR